MLESKEVQVRNLEKELETLKCNNKSINVRFDREKTKAE
jgi:cytochrome c-type biogenesis protein CcmH/NrfF